MGPSPNWTCVLEGIKHDVMQRACANSTETDLEEVEGTPLQEVKVSRPDSSEQDLIQDIATAKLFWNPKLE